MSIDPATLSQEICTAFNIECTSEEQLAFQYKIAYHTKFLGVDGIDEIASALFIECHEYRKTNPSLEMTELTRLLSRVQKRILRSASRNDAPSFREETQSPAVREDTETTLRLILGELTTEEAVMLDMRYVQRMTLAEIASASQLSTSTVARHMEAIRQKLAKQLGNGES